MVFIQCLYTPLGIVLFQIIGTEKYLWYMSQVLKDHTIPIDTSRYCIIQFIGTGKNLQYLSQVLKDLIQYLQTHLGIILFNSQVLESTSSICHSQFEAPMVFMQVGNIGSSCMKHLNQLLNHLFYKKKIFVPIKIVLLCYFQEVYLNLVLFIAG